jgi:tripartite-type tricarboxylate transporter receptor subunit TctC
MKQYTKFLFSVLAMLAFSASAVSAQTPFYEGKTIRIIIGFSAGGGFDVSARTIARHLVKYIPGKPNIIVDPMPGAASMVAASYIFSSAKPDGLTIGYVQSSIILQEVLGGSVQFDSTRFEYLGSPSFTTPLCITSTASGITSIDKWKASKEPVKFASAGLTGDIAHDTPMILSHAMGLPLRLITGHKGNAEMKLAVQRGEVAGMCLSLDAANIVWGESLKSGEVRVIIQAGTNKDPALSNVPLARELVDNEQARQLMKVGIELPARFPRVFILPPSTPKDRLEILRKALMATLKDPEYLEDAKKASLDVNPVNGADVEKAVAELHTVTAGVKQNLREALNVK